MSSMAALVLIGTVTALARTEPEQSGARRSRDARARRAFTRVLHAAVGAFSEFLARKMRSAALAFVVLFKFTDAFSGTMTAPFVIDLGFTRNDYAAIVKGVGLAATLIGGFAGGYRGAALFAGRKPVDRRRAAGGLQFVVLVARLCRRQSMGAGVAISAENFTSAIGTVIFVAYLSALCRNPLHTATQYALLTALAAVGRTYLSSGAGYVAEATGWPMFFVICVAGRDPEPDPAGLAAAPRAFRGAGAGEGLRLRYPSSSPRRRGTQYSRAVAIEPRKRGVLGRPVKPGDDGDVCDNGRLNAWSPRSTS